MRLKISMRVAAALLAAPAAFLSAQTPTTRPAITASVRARAEAWDWFNTPARDGAYTFGAVMARVGATQQRARLGWRLELEAPVLIGLPNDAAAPAPAGQLGLGASYWAANDSAENTAGLFLRQAYLRFGPRPGVPGVSVRLGRFEFIEGTETTPANATLAALKRDRIAHRLIGNFAFSHVQRTADGVHLSWDHSGSNVTALAFRPTQGVFVVNGWPDLSINVGYLAFNTRFGSQTQPADARVFAIAYDDRRPVATAAGKLRIYTYGAHYLQLLPVADGKLDLLLWGALQTGTFGPARHRANAFAIEGGVQPQGSTPWQPWVRAGINRSSGTKAGASRHETFFQVLPTPRVYARFPFFNMMNSRDVFATLMLRPSGKVSLRADAHQLRLTEPDDGWYSGGGAFNKASLGYAVRPSNGSGDLAALFDVSADVRPNPHWTVSGYLGFARGGRVVHAIYPNGDNARLGYVEVEWRR